MAKKILLNISEWRPDIIVVEDTWNAVNVEASKMLTCLLGVTFGWAMSNCAEWHKMMPSSWRSYCGIKIGKKKRAELKQDSIDFVKDEFKIEVNDDVADAIGIGIGYINSVALKED